MRDIIITMNCVFCGNAHDVKTCEADYIKWQNGALIQNAMPYLTPTEREQMISRICPNCQRAVFGE